MRCSSVIRSHCSGKRQRCRPNGSGISSNRSGFAFLLRLLFDVCCWVNPDASNYIKNRPSPPMTRSSASDPSAPRGGRSPEASFWLLMMRRAPDLQAIDAAMSLSLQATYGALGQTCRSSPLSTPLPSHTRDSCDPQRCGCLYASSHAWR